MRSIFSSLALVSAALLSGLVQAAPSVERVPYRRGGNHDRGSNNGPTCNSASNRGCWNNNFDINTDYEYSVPTTGVTREYTLVVSEATQWTGPDGEVKELIMLINGTYPGPTLTANWGDTLSVTVVNNLVTNGTSFHWHGIRQHNTNLQDGVNGVTECPLAPGSSKTYTFLAEQYGTTWYHSHFAAQYGNGISGPIIINGPSSQKYDIDLGAFPVSDFYYKGADELVYYAQDHGPPASDNVLFNGTNVHPTTGAGKYASVTLTKGKRHRLRLINTSVENHFYLSLNGHKMTIIAADLVPVQPQTVTSVFMGPGMRYDVTIDANQDVGNYWFNATFATSGVCGSSENPYPAAVFRYQGADTSALPTVQGKPVSEASCLDLDTLVPVVKRTVPVTKFRPVAGNTLPVTLDVAETTPLFTWKVNGSAVDINWNKPIDQYIMEGNSTYPESFNVVTVNGKSDQWAFWLIENTDSLIPHPMHLHGHDFVVLGRAEGTSNDTSYFDANDLSGLKSNNPVRRDTSMLPAYGWMVIAYQINNPGTWVMHCHIAWHVSGGLSTSFVERPTDFLGSVTSDQKTAFNNECAAWNAYFPTNDPYPKIDSGLRIRAVDSPALRKMVA